MTALNAPAAEAMVEAGAEAGTDVTGFGLLGHLGAMLRASGVSADVDPAGPDVLPGALDLARDGVVAGGTRRNHRFVSEFVDWGDLPEPEQLVLADAQTSGGLLIVTTQPERLERALAARRVPFRAIGRTTGGEPGRIRVTTGGALP
jgi:selenide,water dikinase